MSRKQAHRLGHAAWLAGWALTLLLTLQACDRPATRDADAASTHDDTTLRIVSLTPSITQMLIDMGKRDQVVGVSADDRQVEGLPRVGPFNAPDIEKLLQLKPDIVITESRDGKRSEIPQRLVSLAEQGVFEIAVYPHFTSIDDIERVLAEPEQGIGHRIGDPKSARVMWDNTSNQITAIATVLEGQPRPRVLMLIEPQTLGTLGVGVLHDELLQYAGAVNAAASYDTGYLTLTRSQVQLEAKPDVILIFEPDGLPLAEGDERLRALKGLDIPAVNDGRVVLIDHPQGLLTSTSVPGVLAQMAKAIHPEQSEAIDGAYAKPQQESP